MKITTDILDSDRITASILFARYKGKWVLVRQETKQTWEVPGGRLEPNENIYDCATRELHEETGATKFNLKPVCYYSHDAENQTAGVFAADIEELVDLPDSEIAEIKLFDKMPANISYPKKYAELMPIVEQFIKERGEVNVYKNPTSYLRELQKRFIMPNQKKYTGKSTIAVFFTKICRAGCRSCFYGSTANKSAEFSEATELSEEGFQKFLNFVNTSNNGYLMVSGGGEPFEKPDFIIRTVEQAKTDKIVLVTSGYWATNNEKCAKMLQKIYAAKQKRGDNLDLVLRVSLDEFHVDRIGARCIENIIRAFEGQFNNAPNFRLQIHTLQNDKSVQEIMNKINARHVGYKEDPKDIHKNKNCYMLQTENGLQIQVEEAKLFYSNQKQNIQDPNNPILVKARNVFNEDLRNSQHGNFSKVEHPDGSVGLDYLISHNGDITTWGNYQRDNIPNLYIDSPTEIQNKLYNDIFSYSFLDKDFDVRCNIVKEINPKAADRAVLINVRDYSGACLLEENKTALYYGIRTIQNYIGEGQIQLEDLENLTPELRHAITQSKEVNAQLYEQSDYTIFNQLAEYPFEQGVWDDTFELVELGHYEVSAAQASRATDYYNRQLQNTKNRSYINPDQHERLLHRLNPMNSEAAAMFRTKYAQLSQDNEQVLGL
ncbi:MAG: NUDIX domain-containing protein [Christensenellaceae bacterium]|jgi:8-oxo-dGTP pyrophosphatase MutT (NUDIX family)|nr:NUDIX domain-containing protein [Christensenellaceae bacterium]